MRILLEQQSGEPIYQQIVEAIKFQIALGRLAVGDRLPSIRELADDLQINTRTVVKAYEELVRAGLAVMQQGRGVFVTAPQATLPAKERRKVIIESARRLMAEATRLGASPAEVCEIMTAVAQELEPSQ